jgi:hypothetical protein
LAAISLLLSNSVNLVYAGSIAEAATTTASASFDSNVSKVNYVPILSEDEIRQQRVNNALEWAEQIVEDFDGIPVISRGAAELVSLGQGINELNKQIKKKYHIRLKANDSGAAVAYKVKF